MILSLITLFLAAAEPASPETPVVVVTTQADSGPGSLRQAIVDVPANGNIGFGVEGEILLTSGELVVHKPLHSPAIDAGDATTAPLRDQRSVKRPQGPASDVGSVEVETP